MANAKTSLWDATLACYQFLLSELDFKDGQSAWMDDNMDDHQAINAFIFMSCTDPGREQSQNYQGAANQPGFGWVVPAELLGQFETLKDAYEFVGKLQNIDNPHKRAGSFRALNPNVQEFRPRLGPHIYSRWIGEEGSQLKVWMVNQSFDIVYYNSKD